MIDLKKYKLFLLDMDGTIYHDSELIPGALDFFSLLQKRNLDYVFMTNNSSKNEKNYVVKLHNLGIESSERNIISSVSVTKNHLLNFYKDAKIYLVGTHSLKEELIEAGLNIVEEDYHFNDVDLVLIGFDTELNYIKIQNACFHLNNGAHYLGTNCDLKCPIKNGRFIPDCGAIAQMLQIATGRTPEFLGKPMPLIAEMAAKEFNRPKEEILCIGDRLYTDIAVGINANIDTALVLTGETQIEDLEHSTYTPTYIFNSIEDIYKALV